jgi:hypothetical protein
MDEAITQTRDEGNEAEKEALRVLLSQIFDIAEKAPSHRLMLIALLSAYAAVATAHPCCTETAGRMAMLTGGGLLTSSDGVAQNATVH